ncbi:type I-U CRISPR-associated helicase/endonuclease Cas3 [Streptomyces sp. NPDC101150]|uniref:type I-G CRISPR-associated helicase/endonuclease Cas3g n=1 Tax=Streptomyces sp. NPDC101150 TaxID=3366114 RepID=UPI00382A1385
MSLELEDFPVFVEQVHGYRPFPWQVAYLQRVAQEGVWPDLDVPTGLGKTSLIDIWAFLLAWQAEQGLERTVPLRLFLVVDRRLVVDQAHDHATVLRKALDAAASESVAGHVAAALQQVGGEGVALEAIRMRGGVDWASRWLRSPAQPAVISSTVDQYGSRLVFRGYRTSARMRPIDAALCGMDALVAVDEAHIALPLLQTAVDCAAYQHTATEAVLADRAVRVVSLSATAHTGPDRPRHAIADADRQHPVAGRRLAAQRRLTLLDARSPKAKGGPAAVFAQATNAALEALLPVLARPVVGVVANTIRTARAVHEQLCRRDDVDVLLLTGRSRGSDRELLCHDPTVRELLTGVRPDRARPLVVVATQTVEVGLDVSFAGLITENTAVASLVQRLGRLDRTGDFDLAPAVVIRSFAGEAEDTPVYGTAATVTWEWLATHTPTHTLASLTSDGLRELLGEGLLLNPTTLPTLLEDTGPSALNVPDPLIPVIDRRLLDSWARTSPTPVPDQSPAPFLHGLDTSPEDVHVLWRADLLTHDGRPDFAQWGARMDQVPPHPGETVALPAAHLRRFLTRPTDGDDTSDLEATHPTPTAGDGKPARAKAPEMAPVVRLDEAENTWHPALAPGDIRPGDTVALPSSYSGHDAYGFTGAPGQPVPDLGDFPPRTDTAPTRLDTAILALLTDTDADIAALEKALANATARLRVGDNDDPPTVIVRELLDTLTTHFLSPTVDSAPEEEDRPWSGADLLRQRLAQLRAVPRWDLAAAGRSTTTGHVICDPDNDARLLLIPAHRKSGQLERTAGVGDDSADASSLTRPVPLPQHSKAVADRAAAFALRLHLPHELATAIETGAHAHDCGKEHPRFQCVLCAGDHLLAETLPEPLAKSGMDPADRVGRRRAARLANWPAELRHEALSALAVQAWLTTSPAHTEGQDKDLLVHLVASHHGHARPLLPPAPDPDPIEVTCTMPDQQRITVNSAGMGVDWDGPDRFAALNRRYGPWGLALMETLVRLADMACSEEGA